MHKSFRVVLLAVAILCGLALDVSNAYAQAACDQLVRQLRTLERNTDFRNFDNANQQSRALGSSLQNAESAYVRNGCNAAAKAGQTLTRDCQNLARQILKGRADRDQLSASLETGNAVAQQREAVLQEMSRFGCRAGSQANVTQQNGQRGTLFDQLFGGYTQDPNSMGGYGDGDIIGDDFSGYGGYRTVRTVCARLSDGFFWPISFSTLPDYLANDLEKCQSECPGTQVDLYYYNNPGGEPEQMVNLAGGRYSALPNAFAYRTKFDAESTCKPSKTGTGFTSVAGGEDTPIPPNDPREPDVIEAAAQQQVVASLDIPLPRPRPSANDPTVTQEIAAPVQTAKERVVKFGDKTVRIVGPDTPYARLAGAAP
jgi:hypothetical protein